MGKDLAQTFSTAQQLFDRASSVLGYDLASICFQGPAETLTETENAQPGIYLVSWVAFQLLKEQLPRFSFDATAGLSLGEFTALAAAGAFSFEEGLKVVRQRGRFMQEACDATQGTMAAVLGLDVQETQKVCQEAGVSLANLNCPGQLVISGETAKVEKACEMAKSRGAKRAKTLPVAGAYHSPLMASAQPKLKAALDSIAIQAPRVPVYSNVTAQPHSTPPEIAARLIEQVTAPVQWEASIREMLAAGYRRFIELGPGNALSGFMKRIDPTAACFNVADAATLKTTVEALRD